MIKVKIDGLVRQGVRAVVLIALGLLGASVVWSQQQSPTLWVGGAKSILSVSSADGNILTETILSKGANALAINHVNGDIWIYSKAGFEQLSSAGYSIARYAVPPPLHKKRVTEFVIDGNLRHLWAAADDGIFQMDLEGNLLESWKLDSDAIDMVFDYRNSEIWVAGVSSIQIFGGSGEHLRTIKFAENHHGKNKCRVSSGYHDKANTEQPAEVVHGEGKGGGRKGGGSDNGSRFGRGCVVDLAYDSGLAQVWVGLEDRLLRLNRLGESLIEWHMNVNGQIEADGNGGVWVVDGDNLVHLDATGVVDLQFRPFSNKEGPRHISGLAADPTDSSVWITNSKVLGHFDVLGQRLHLIDSKSGTRNIKKIAQLSLIADVDRPELRILAPANGILINQQPKLILEVSGSGNEFELDSLVVEVRDVPVDVVCELTESGADCQFAELILDGEVIISATIADGSGNRSQTATVKFNLDTLAPVIELISPVEGAFTSSSLLVVNGAVNEAAQMTINATDVLVDDSLAFATTFELREGANNIHIQAKDLAGNSTDITRSVILDTIAPAIPDVSQIYTETVDNETVQITGGIAAAEPGAQIRLANRRTGQSVITTAALNGGFAAHIAARVGDVIEIRAIDAASNLSGGAEILVQEDGGGGVTDPSINATPLSKTEITPFADSIAFLYSAGNPNQTGVDEGRIDARRVSVVRGRTLDRNNDPLPGVVVRVKDHPEFGQTLSRADGQFDLVVNGGDVVTLDYNYVGHLPAQRQLTIPQLDYVVAEDVVLVEFDEQVTQIVAGSGEVQVASGAPVVDADGFRQATLVFDAGTTAEMLLPNGDRQPLSQFSVRATEYTVGENGLQAMPGVLPSSSGYTYAVELSVDEAIQAGATSVEFNQPVWFYVDNFLDFPVGGVVPVGWYDRRKAAWIPSKNGRVISVLAITNGVAELDVNGSGEPASTADYENLGFTIAERVQIASRFELGQSFWRTGITHFTPWDCNWPYGPPPDAEDPRLPRAKSDDQILSPDIECGSIIECQNQVLSERIPIAGTPYNLVYRSDRVSGRKIANSLEITLSGSSVPASLKKIILKIEVAGQYFIYYFPPIENQKFDFLWDGNDAYGRQTLGQHKALVSIGYEYDAVYYEPSDFERSFGAFSSSNEVVGVQGRPEITIWQSDTYTIGRVQHASPAIGEWTLPIHHAYSPSASLLVRGDGIRSEQGAQGNNFSGVITTVAGNGQSGFSGDGGNAAQAQLDGAQGIAVAEDGSVYIADYFNHRIRHIGTDGIIRTIAGTGVSGYSGDNGPASQAQLNFPINVDVGPDGSVYVVDYRNYRIRRIGPGGIIETVAGNGEPGADGDGGLAIEAQLSALAVAVGDDNSLFLTDHQNDLIRRVGPDGIIETIAGTDQGFSGDGGPAAQAQLNGPYGLALASDGTLFVADHYNNRVRRIGPDGIISTIAGNGQWGDGGDGGLAIQASLAYPTDVSIARDGSVIVADLDSNRVRGVGRDGVIGTVAGTGQWGFSGDGFLAEHAKLNGPIGIASGAQGELYIADTRNYRIRMVGRAIAGFERDEILVVPSEDSSKIHTFNLGGRHLRTVDALTGGVDYLFDYDAAGRLISVIDGDNNLMTIERDSGGQAIAIEAPSGQRTELVVGSQGELESVTDPGGASWFMSYERGGLLSSFTTPRHSTSLFTYDDMGRLTRDANAVGGFYEFTRDEQESGYVLTKQSAEGRTTTYVVEYLSAGDELSTIVDSDGTQSTRLRETDATRTHSAANGTVSERVLGPDPRFGMQSPITSSLRISTPHGLAFNITNSRDVELSDSADPFSLISLSNTTGLNGDIWHSTYTSADRRIVETSPENRQVTTLVDERFRVLSREISGLLPIESAYDARGRLISMSRGQNGQFRTTRFTYGTDGYLASVTDAANRTHSYQRDVVGRVVRKVLPDGHEINFSYDPSGNLTSINPPGREAHLFTYDAVDMAESYTPPELPEGSSVTQHHYNLDKQLISVNRPGGGAVTYTYSSQGKKLSTVTIAEGNYDFSYDSATGQLISVSAPHGASLNLTYDGFLLTSEAISGPIIGNLSWTWNNDFRIRELCVSNVSCVDYEYDADGLLTDAGDLSLIRDSQNGLIKASMLGQMRTSRSYNNFGELEQTEARFAETTLYSASYQRDKLGRITQKSETVLGEARAAIYGYNSSGRLQSVSVNGEVVANYSYDANGNRLSHNGVMATYDAHDRLLSYGQASFTYKESGELGSRTESGATTTYDYDVLGNLRAVALPGDIDIEYVVDGRNRRIGKMVNGGLTQAFLYRDQLNPVVELDGASNIVSRFVYAENAHVPSYMIRGGAIYRIISDELGSPHLIVKVDDGSIAQRLEYDEFGNVTVDTNPGFQPFGFAGGLYDLHTGLIRFGARDYDPVVGRWTAKDPIGFGGGDLNLYAYVSSDPLNAVDPTGLQGNFFPSPSQMRNYTYLGGQPQDVVNAVVNAPSVASQQLNEYIGTMLDAAATVGTGLAAERAAMAVTPQMVRSACAAGMLGAAACTGQFDELSQIADDIKLLDRIRRDSRNANQCPAAGQR